MSCFFVNMRFEKAYPSDACSAKIDYLKKSCVGKWGGAFIAAE